MKYIKLYENFLDKTLINIHGRNIVWKRDDIEITVDSIDDAKYIALWDLNAVGRNKVGFLILSNIRIYKGEEYRKLDTVEIEPKYRNSGYGLLLYKVALKYLKANIDGIFSYLPDRVNKKEVPRIYKKLNSWNDGGDYEYIKK